ncbi:hypothetical protein [Flavobacterium sp.]|uniref:hypothetical protein n=1 Tax=Flavobacterium sp. TaxID=239 RepID=UPI00286CCE39|nr:hypothetical protein [Flavobacterium sp.]
MKKILSILILAITITAQAQDKAVSITLKENYRNIGTEFTENGTFFMVTGNDKLKKTIANITCYDSVLNVKYSTEFPSRYEGKPSYGITTPQNFFRDDVTFKGKHIASKEDNIILDDNGNIKPFPYYYPNELKDFEKSFDIMTDDYKCYFGYMKADKKKTQTTVCRVNLETAAKEFVALNFPAFESLLTAEKVQRSEKEDAKKIWGISRYDNKQFFMINKELSKDWSQNQYNIASFDYDGKLNPNTSISVLLQLKNKYFALSDTGFGSSKIVSGAMVGGAYMDEAATGNIYVEGKNEFYYIYGLYANEKNSNMNKAKYNGFYVFKYNAKGELVWKMDQVISNSKFNDVQRPLAITVDFRMLPNNQFGLNIYSEFEKYAHMFLMGSKDGKVIKNQSPFYKIDQYRHAGVDNGSFRTGFVMEKEFKNKYMDINTVFATFLSPKVNTLLSKASTGNMNYNCEITNNGIFMIEEDMTTKQFQLMKFDW